jgi:tetratricopeptide (TPR) repeat protein
MAKFSQRLGLTRYEADEYYKQALAAYGKMQLEQAILDMNQAIELLPNNAEYYAARGLFYLEDGVKDKAQADFEQALKLHRHEMLANFGRGIIAYNDKNWDEALAHFLDAYAVEPQRPEILYYLALTYHRKGNNNAALPYMEQAQAAFEATSDKRRTDANRWVKEFQRLMAQAQKPLPIQPPASPRSGQLPLLKDETEEK